MRLAEVVAQLKAASTLLNGRVFGGAEFAAAREGEGDVTKPSAYVVPLAEISDTDALEVAGRMALRQRFAVFVVQATVDDRGSDAVFNAARSMRNDMVGALRGYRPHEVVDPRGIVYVGGELEAMDRSVLWWRYDFEMIETPYGFSA